MRTEFPRVFYIGDAVWLSLETYEPRQATNDRPKKLSHSGLKFIGIVYSIAGDGLLTEYG